MKQIAIMTEKPLTESQIADLNKYSIEPLKKTNSDRIYLFNPNLDWHVVFAKCKIGFIGFA